MAGGVAISPSNGKEYPGKLTLHVFKTCIVAAMGGLIFGYDLGISGNILLFPPPLSCILMFYLPTLDMAIFSLSSTFVETYIILLRCFVYDFVNFFNNTIFLFNFQFVFITGICIGFLIYGFLFLDFFKVNIRFAWFKIRFFSLS